MSKLIYITNMSLDGYIEDKNGAFDWVKPDQVFDYITELLQPIGTHLLGRRLYETMTYWDADVDGYPPEQRDFARVWQKADKVIFSRALATAPQPKARIERRFDPETVRALKRSAGHDVFIGGAEIAGLAFRAGLVDECRLFINPILVGGGKPAFSSAAPRHVELLETRRFGNGVIHMHYRIPRERA